MTDVPTSLCAGVVGDRDLLDLLRQFARLEVSGVVHLACGELKAQIHLRQGGIRAAFLGDHAGAAALTRAILAGPGTFQLQPPVEGVPRNVVHETGFVLDSIAKVLADTRPSGRRPAAAPAAEADQGATERYESWHAPQPGDVVGRCRLLEPIGQGMSALVFRARHLALDLDVVVKVLVAGGARGERLRRLTGNEARLLARLNHPNIVRLFDFDDDGKHPHLVMEWVDGPSLAALLRSRGGRLPAEDALPVFTQVAEALAYAHDTLGLVHCDLKPDNILLTSSGQAKLLDLGLAKATRGSERILVSDVVVGTPSYIAPEQVQGGHAAADRRCDIYALGASLYHCLAGRPPFVHEDPLQVMVMRLHGDPLPLASLDPGIDGRLSDLVQAMLARDPVQRPASYDEVLAGFAEAGEHRRLTDAEERIIRRRSSFWRAVPQLFGAGIDRA